MAMALTSIVGMAAAGMTYALSTAQAGTEQRSEALQSARIATEMIGADVRKAALVTAGDSRTLSLWMGDSNNDKAVNPAELILIRYDADAKLVQRIRLVLAAGQLDGTLNADKTLQQVATVSCVESILGSAAYSDKLETAVLASDVRSFTWRLDQPAPNTRWVQVQMSVGAEKKGISVTHSALLRADMRRAVDNQASPPVLKLE